MRPAIGIIRWESTTHPSRWGVEIAEFALRQHRLEAELDKCLGEMTVVPPTFVFTALGSAHPDEIAVAVSRASDFSCGSRVCVALDHAALSAMDATLLRSKNVGIVLDQVDFNTPPSALCIDLVEAIRFQKGFVQRAAADARMTCAMDALLKLAHDLGLATLAASAPGGRSKAAFEFDYVSNLLADAEQVGSIAVRTSETHAFSR